MFSAIQALVRLQAAKLARVYQSAGRTRLTALGEDTPAHPLDSALPLVPVNVARNRLSDDSGDGKANSQAFTRSQFERRIALVRQQEVQFLDMLGTAHGNRCT